MNLPGAIIFINDKINDGIKSVLSTQLFLNEIIDGYVFDARVAENSNYPWFTKNQNLRILVVRDYFIDQQNRQFADVVIYFKNGLVSIEESRFGPPKPAFPLNNLSIYYLLA